jgi:transcriptional accessory protein Tex/SPT6
MQLVMDSPMDYDSWHDIVQKMLDRGADATDDQLQDIMDWLHHTLTTINVNSADPDELQLVLDVTPQVARDIVARRTAHRFADLADLKSVPGIDSSVLDAKTRLIFFQ